jgi:Domain of unknown function (DUF4334)/GXWXG protein
MNTNTLETAQTVIQQGKTTTDEALTIFDELEPVNLDFMMGRWKGSGLHTNHPMDGLLEAANWYGKEFIDSECVHPLLFLDNDNKIFKFAPNPTAINLVTSLPVLKEQNQITKSLFSLVSMMFKTEESQARLRMMEYRQKISATMIYDNLPINDIFRKVDDNTVLGLMDFKGKPQPFFFVLKRDILESSK